MAYARQLPREDSTPVESYTREFNYPAKSRIKSAADLDSLGIKTFFCSNVCAAYRREIYEELGGFVRHTIFNEDMIYAAKAVEAGYSVAYAADAQVVHSHNYTNGQQFHRNFDLGVSQAEHPEIFAAYPSESEGKRMVKDVTVYLRSNHMSAGLPHFICNAPVNMQVIYWERTIAGSRKNGYLLLLPTRNTGNRTERMYDYVWYCRLYWNRTGSTDHSGRSVQVGIPWI